MVISKFQIFKRPLNGEFYFRLRSQSGQVILSGEGYKTRLICKRQILWIKSNASDDSRYERLGHLESYRFQLRKSEQEVMWARANYPTDSARDEGIEDVKRNASVAVIEDLSIGIFI